MLEVRSLLTRCDQFQLSVSPSDDCVHSSPAAGSCPTNRPSSSRRCKKSPRSTSVCPWRTRSCCGSCTTVTCWRVPAACHPPHPSTPQGTLPPFLQLPLYHPDNSTGNTPLSSDLLITFLSLGRSEEPDAETEYSVVGYELLNKHEHFEQTALRDTYFESDRCSGGTDALRSISLYQTPGSPTNSVVLEEREQQAPQGLYIEPHSHSDCPEFYFFVVQTVVSDHPVVI